MGHSEAQHWSPPGRLHILTVRCNRLAGLALPAMHGAVECLQTVAHGLGISLLRHVLLVHIHNRPIGSSIVAIAYITTYC